MRHVFHRNVAWRALAVAGLAGGLVACGSSESLTGSTTGAVSVVSGGGSAALGTQGSFAAGPLKVASRGVPSICSADEIQDLHPDTTIGINGSAIVFDTPGKKNQYIKGFNFRAFITSTEHALAMANSDDEKAGFYEQSYHANFLYGPEQLEVLKKWNMNTVRFQVSQRYMAAGENDTVANTYKKCITNAVRLARNEGFLVILAMQWQKNPEYPVSGTGNLNRGMPTTLTETAWGNVNKIFKDDSGIIYDLFNEPFLSPYKADNKALDSDATEMWKIWRKGGPVNGGPAQGGFEAYGHQKLVTYLRTDLRSTKVLIAEGLSLGDSFEKALVDENNQTLASPLSGNKIAYSVHPYARGFVFDKTTDVDTPGDPYDGGQLEGYTRRWGYLLKQKQLPLIVTEWLQGGGAGEDERAPTKGIVGYRLARDLINYVNNNNIPMVASAFDVDGPVVTGNGYKKTPGWTPVWAPTNFDNWFATTTPDPGPEVRARGNSGGILLCRFFRAGYDPAKMYGDEHLKSARLTGEATDSPCLVKEP